MIRAEALKVLGLVEAEGSSVRSIRAAFANACRMNHPDTADADAIFDRFPSQPPKELIPIRYLQLARDVLLDSLSLENRACKLCAGRGRVRARMGWSQCGSCSGTGEQR